MDQEVVMERPPWNPFGRRLFPIEVLVASAAVLIGGSICGRPMEAVVVVGAILLISRSTSASG